MADGVKLSPDELEGATEIAPVKLSPEEIAGATPIEAPKDDRGFFARAKDTLEGGARAIGDVAKDGGAALIHGVTHPIDSLLHPSGPLTDPAKRRQLERGIDDVVTLGHGQKLASAIGEGLGDKPDESLSRTAEADQQKAPEYRTAGGIAGSFLPNPVGAVAGIAGKVAVPVAERLAPGTEKFLSSLASKRIVGPAAVPAAVAAGATRGVARYESTAPAAAALSANAEGHRLDAAKDAALDPAGILTSAATGTVAPTIETAGKVAKNFVENAKTAADEYIPKDIVGNAKGASTPTVRAQMARAAADFPEVIGKDPELRTAIVEAQKNDLPKVKRVVELMQDRLNDNQADKPEIYKQIDQALPDSGVRMKDVVSAIKNDIHDWEHSPEKGGQEYSKQIAGKLKERLRDITGSEAFGAKRVADLPEQAKNDVQSLEQVRGNLEQRIAGGRAPKGSEDDLAQINKQIDAIKATGTERHEFDPDAIVSTRALRRLATDAQNTAFTGEGSINGTERYKRALDVSKTFSGLLDAQLERARDKAPEAVQRLEDMDRTTHALLAAKAVMDDRLSSATQNSIGAGGKTSHAAHSLGQLGRQVGGMSGAAIMAGTGHYLPAAITAAAVAAPAIQRAAYEGAAKWANSPNFGAQAAKLAHVASITAKASDFIRGAISAGIPAEAARRIWVAAHSPEPQQQEATP